MSGPTKVSLSTGWSNTPVAAGASQTGTVMDLTGAYGALLTVQATTTTAPTSNGTLTISLSVDNTNWEPYATATIPMVTSSVVPYSWDLPIGLFYVRVDIAAGTGTGITLSAQCGAVTAL